jgi:hypothetical protein
VNAWEVLFDEGTEGHGGEQLLLQDDRDADYVWLLLFDHRLHQMLEHVAIHIHLRIRTYSGTTVTGVFTSQLHFDDTISDSILSQAPYNTRGTRDTRNSNDMVYTGSANASRTLLTLTTAASGYNATINVGVNLTPTTGSRPCTRTSTRAGEGHSHSTASSWWNALQIRCASSGGIPSTAAIDATIALFLAPAVYWASEVAKEHEKAAAGAAKPATAATTQTA